MGVSSSAITINTLYNVVTLYAWGEHGAMAKPEFYGVFPAMITPFTKAEEVDETALKKIIGYLIESGIHGIQCCGSTGEAGSLIRSERKRIIELTVNEVNRRLPVIAGTGTSSTKLTVELTRDAADAGADAALIITPFYVIPTEEGIYEHYRTIAGQVDIPIIAYNVPQATMVNLTPIMLKRLVEEIDGIVGVKESSGKTWQIAEMIRLVGDKISILTGDDAGLYPDLLLGCQGAIVAIGNIAPRMAVEIFDSVRRGDIQRAREAYYRLLSVATALGGEANWASRVKAMVNLQNLPGGYVRKPYLEPLPEEVQQMKVALTYAGLIRG
jgi:4-hydroxy-tetrahydrodipicolinate synthase